MRHLDLFSGIGGFALAASWVWPEHEIAAFCEKDEFCRRILAKHWPAASVVEDIRDLNGRDYANVDLLTGGFPCQPFSAAGQRRGTQDDRYLWPEMLRVIREAQPTWILAENVVGIASMELKHSISQVESRTVLRTEDYDLYRGVLSREETMLLYALCDDLEAEGYAAQPVVIPACGVGAPHRRRRVWIVGYAECEGLALGQSIGRGIRTQQPSIERGGASNGRRQSQSGLGRGAYGVSAWLDGSWERGIPRVARDIPDRVNRLKGLGNAIVPWLVAEIFRAIKHIDNGQDRKNHTCPESPLYPVV